MRSFLEPRPYPLIKNGKIVNANLKKARISLEILLTELRKEKIDDIQKVALALWEPGGTLSIFLHSQHRPLTPTDMQLIVKPFSFPMPIIKEGQIDSKILNQLNKDEEWLKNKISTLFDIEIKDILLATIDQNDKVKVFMYD